MTKQATSKYTPAMEQALRDAPVLNLAVATAFAEQFGDKFTARSVVAKINRMGLAYERKLPVTKTGEKVEQKATIVAEIAEFVQGNLDGLDKAPKAALQALRNALTA